MILDYIVMENIRSYRHEEIEFPMGVSLFEGDIGSGKSTILMSIEFALFGLGSQKAESLLAKNTSSGKVTLGFSVNGKKYEVQRALIKNSTIAQDSKSSCIIVDGQKEPLSTTELKQRILQILKFNEPTNPRAESRIFRYAVFTPQETMKNVLSDEKMRLETIRKAFGIEDYNIAASNADALLQKIKGSMNVLQERFKCIEELEMANRKSDENIAEIEKSVSQITQTKGMHEEAERTVSAELDSLRKRSEKKNRTEVKIEAKKTEIQDCKKTISRIEDNKAADQDELRKYNMQYEELSRIKKPDILKTVEELDAEIGRFRKISDELIRHNAKRDSIIEDISRLKRSLGDAGTKSNMTENLEMLQRQNDSLELKLQELEEGQKKTEGQKAESHAERKRLEIEMERIEKLGNRCLTCSREISDAERIKLVSERREKAGVLAQKILDAKRRIEETDNSIKENRANVSAKGVEINRIRQIIPQIDELESKTSGLNLIESEIARLNQENAGGQYGKDPIKSLTDARDQLIRYENARGQKERTDAAIREKQARILAGQKSYEEQKMLLSGREKELEILYSEYESADLQGQIRQKDAQLRELREKIGQSMSLLERNNAQISAERVRMSENKSRIDEAKKWKEQHAYVSECHEWIKQFLIPTARQIEKQLLLSILRDFDETYRRWYSILVEDPTKESRIDEGFTPTVSQSGYEQNLEYLSGGEKTSIALAYRLTLNSLMRKEVESMRSNLLILDEPTDGFSKNHLDKMRDVLDELGSEQIILVSHERELESRVDHVFRVSKQDGVSKVSAVS